MCFSSTSYIPHCLHIQAASYFKFKCLQTNLIGCGQEDLYRQMQQLVGFKMKKAYVLPAGRATPICCCQTLTWSARSKKFLQRSDEVLRLRKMMKNVPVAHVSLPASECRAKSRAKRSPLGCNCSLAELGNRVATFAHSSTRQPGCLKVFECFFSFLPLKSSKVLLSLLNVISKQNS